MEPSANSLYPVPIWQFVLVLVEEHAELWGERHIDWIVKKLQERRDNIFYHRSASNSSLATYVRENGISLAGKTAHCDVQNTVWRLNLDAGNDKCPIDPLWTEPKYRFFRNAKDSNKINIKYIDLPSFDLAKVYADELSRRPYRQIGRGIICPAKDGCFCRSQEEVCIDDWFSDHGIEHEKEPSYPSHQILNKRARKKADWRINDVLIEYAGLSGDKKYDARIADKIQIAKDTNTELVIILRSDLTKLDSKLSRFL